jgi:hypothetical protein
MIRAELRQALRDGLDELPARDRQLLQLRASDPQKSYHEISETARDADREYRPYPPPLSGQAARIKCNAGISGNDSGR